MVVCQMAKARVYRERIMIELDREVRQEIAQRAVSEGRPISNLLRHVLSDLIAQRMAARSRGAAARGPIQKQLTA